MKLPCHFELTTHEKVDMFEKVISAIYKHWLHEEVCTDLFIKPDENIANLKKVSINKDTKLIEDLHLSKNGVQYLSESMSEILNRKHFNLSSDFKDVTISQFSEFF